VKVATHHAEAHRRGPGVSVVEGLFLDGVHLKSRGVASWNSEVLVAHVAHPAGSLTAFGEQAPMPASNATQAPVALPQGELGGRRRRANGEC